MPKASATRCARKMARPQRATPLRRPSGPEGDVHEIRSRIACFRHLRARVAGSAAFRGGPRWRRRRWRFALRRPWLERFPRFLRGPRRLLRAWRPLWARPLRPWPLWPRLLGPLVRILCRGALHLRRLVLLRSVGSVLRLLGPALWIRVRAVP